MTWIVTGSPCRNGQDGGKVRKLSKKKEKEKNSLLSGLFIRSSSWVSQESDLEPKEDENEDSKILTLAL